MTRFYVVMAVARLLWPVVRGLDALTRRWGR
jgi:hypothetical protein